MKKYFILSLFCVCALAACATSIVVPDTSGVANTPDTVLLIPSNTTDASTTFEDTSRGGVVATPTAYANAQHDTAQKKFGTTSIKFDGSGDALHLADDDDYDFGTGDLTIDFWFRFSAITSDKLNWMFGSWEDSADRLYIFLYNYSTTNVALRFFAKYGNTERFNMTSTQFTPGTTWHHYAIVRYNVSSWKFYQDGVFLDEFTDSDSFDNLSEDIYGVGGNMPSGGHNTAEGWIDDFRITKRAIWLTEFTPPTRSN